MTQFLSAQWPDYPCPARGCTYRAIDAADLREHIALNAHATVSPPPAETFRSGVVVWVLGALVAWGLIALIALCIWIAVSVNR